MLDGRGMSDDELVRLEELVASWPPPPDAMVTQVATIVRPSLDRQQDAA